MAGLIASEKQARRRLCRANSAALAPVRDLLAETAAAMAAQTDRLEDYLLTLQRNDDAT